MSKRSWGGRSASFHEEDDVGARLYAWMKLFYQGVSIFEGTVQSLALKNRTTGPITQKNPQGPAAEAYRKIRMNIQFAGVDGDLKVVLTTSTAPGEGKTSTSCNLAVVMAQSGKRVLLIDADLRKPQVHQYFQVSNVFGLSNLLIRERSLQDCVLPTSVSGLYVLPSGDVPSNPSELLESRSFSELIQTLRDKFDVIVLDSPPIASVADALGLSRMADGVVFVVNAQKTHRSHVMKAIQSLHQVNAKVLGVVLNRTKRGNGESYYYQSYYSSKTTSTAT